MTQPTRPFAKPLLVIAGLPRTGTTSIYHNLSLHPAFAAPARKELNYFCSEPLPPLGIYESYFAGSGDRICVDSSPLYSLHSSAAARLAAAAPQARVVLLLRPPANWLLSCLLQARSLRPSPLSLPQFLAHPFPQLADVRIADGVIEQSVMRFAHAFGENLLLLDFGMLERDPLAALRAIESFAGAAPYFSAQTVDASAFNSAQLAVRASPRLRRLLATRAVAAIVPALFPARLIQRLRRGADRDDARRPAETLTDQFTPAERRLAESHMPNDTRFTAKLFRAAPLRNGATAT